MKYEKFFSYKITTNKKEFYANRMKDCYKEYKNERDVYYKRQWKSLLFEWAKKFISEIKK